MGGFLLNNAPIPMTDPIARPKRGEFGPKQDDPLEGRLTDPWADYISRMALSINRASTRISSVSLTDQGGSIAATDLSGGALKAGLYRITFYARITQAATTSSSLDITIAWTDGSVAQSDTATSITGNTTATHQTISYTFHADAFTPITYSTVYGSVGATSMQYRLDIILEAIQV